MSSMPRVLARKPMLCDQEAQLSTDISPLFIGEILAAAIRMAMP